MRTNTQVSDMRILHVDTSARLSAKAAHEMQTFLRELRKLKKMPTNTWHKRIYLDSCQFFQNMLYYSCEFLYEEDTDGKKWKKQKGIWILEKY